MTKKSDSNTTIKEITKTFLSFSRERNWEKNYSPNYLAKSVIIEAAELLEFFQWKDKNSSKNINQSSDEYKGVAFEVVDVLYYLLMFADSMNIDLTLWTNRKLENLADRYPASKVKNDSDNSK